MLGDGGACVACAAKWQCGEVETALVCSFSQNTVPGARARFSHLHHVPVEVKTISAGISMLFSTSSGFKGVSRVGLVEGRFKNKPSYPKKS